MVPGTSFMGPLTLRSMMKFPAGARLTEAPLTVRARCARDVAPLRDRQ